MKNTYKFLCSFLLISLLFSCKKNDIGGELKEPNVSVSVFPQNPKVGDSVTITLSTDAEYLTIFTGDSSHEFSKSRINAIMQNDWNSFYDTVYRVSYAKKGMATTWNRYLKDYNTLDDVKKDFGFFGAISDIQLGVFNDFSESLINTTYPTQNQLKFTITDRRIPSGIIIKQPNIFLLGGNNNTPAFSIFETRFVMDSIDRAVRKKANTYLVPAYFDISTREVDTNKDTTIHAPLYYFRAFQTNDPLTARPTEGFYRFGDLYNGNSYLSYFLNNAPDKLMMTELKVYMNGRSTENNGSYMYDLNNDGIAEGYEVPLNPATGLPQNESDYPKYGGFEGDVYVSYINLGTNEYEPWNLGVSLGSVYLPNGITKEYKYVYTKPSDITITAVATNIGRKQYSDDGYQQTRAYSLNDYPAKRRTASVMITVGQ